MRQSLPLLVASRDRVNLILVNKLLPEILPFFLHTILHLLTITRTSMKKGPKDKHAQLAGDPNIAPLRHRL